MGVAEAEPEVLVRGAGPMIGIMSGVQGRMPIQGSGSTRSPSGKKLVARSARRGRAEPASWAHRGREFRPGGQADALDMGARK